MYPLLGSKILSLDDPRLSAAQDQFADPATVYATWLQRTYDKLQLPEVVLDNAIRYFSKTGKFESLRGLHCKKEACLFLACRTCGIPQRIREFSDITGERPAKILRTAYEVADALGLRVKARPTDRGIFNAIEKLDLPRELYLEVTRLLPILDSKAPHGALRETTAGAVVWILLQEVGGIWSLKTQYEIAEALGIAEFSVRDRVAELKKDLKAENSPDFTTLQTFADKRHGSSKKVSNARQPERREAPQTKNSEGPMGYGN